MLDVAETAMINKASIILPERYHLNVLRSLLPSLDALIIIMLSELRVSRRLSVRYLRRAHMGNSLVQQMRGAAEIPGRANGQELSPKGSEFFERSDNRAICWFEGPA